MKWPLKEECTIHVHVICILEVVSFNKALEFILLMRSHHKPSINLGIYLYEMCEVSCLTSDKGREVVTFWHDLKCGVL